MADKDADRTEPATPKRRQDARKKGDVARSRELSATVLMAAGFLTIGSSLGGAVALGVLARSSDLLGGAAIRPSSLADYHAILLHEIGGVGLLLLPIGGLLLLAGLGSWVLSSREAAEAGASNALAEARTGYLAAMGAAPGALEVPELANPEAATRIRNEYRERFSAIAEEHAGTVSAALARMEVAELTLADDDFSGALAIYESALEGGAGGDRFRGVLLQRVAQPLHCRPGDEDTAFQRVGRLAVEAVGHGGQQPVH